MLNKLYNVPVIEAGLGVGGNMGTLMSEGKLTLVVGIMLKHYTFKTQLIIITLLLLL